jgi:hypothetical protein
MKNGFMKMRQPDGCLIFMNRKYLGKYLKILAIPLLYKEIGWSGLSCLELNIKTPCSTLVGQGD